MSQQTIYLDKAQAKCEAYRKPCPQRHTCARFLVSSDSRPSADFTVLDSFKADACPQYLPASKYRTKPVEAVPAKEYVRGLL